MINNKKSKNHICSIKNRALLALCTSSFVFSMFSMGGCASKGEKTSYQLGIDCLKAQNYSEALNYFTTAENEADARLSFRGQGMANLGLGKYDEAIVCFENALHESNGLVKSIDYDINFYMATAQYKKGDYQAAKTTYTSIITMDPKNEDAFYLRGKVALDMNDLQGATSDYDSAIALTPQNADLYVNIYNDLSGHGYANEAKSYINLALKNIAKPSEYQLGIFNYYLGDFTQARNYFEQAKETKNCAEGIIYLGKTYDALGDSGYAQSLYEVYITGDTESSEVYNEVGKLKFKQHDYEGALSSFEAGLKATDISFKQNLLYNRIVTYEYLENFNTAKSLMEEYLSLYPDDAAALRENIFLSTR